MGLIPLQLRIAVPSNSGFQTARIANSNREPADGRLIALEVKAGRTVCPADAKWLVWLRDLVGDRFELGLVLYGGPLPLRLADRVLALPISHLWQV